MKNNLIRTFHTVVTAVSENVWYRHLFLLATTIATILLIGYNFGVFDQASHIPFLRKMADPSLYPHDYFLEIRNYHYSYFWMLFIPFLKSGYLEVTMFLVHCFATYLTFYAIWRLTKTLFNNPIVSLFSVLVFMFPHLSFAGYSIFEFTLVNRTFVFPFLLFAIDWYLKKQYIRSFLLLGLLINFHVISVTFVLILIGFDMLMRFREVGIKNMVQSIIACTSMAIPVLYWKFSNSHLVLGQDSEWFSLISDGLLSNNFHFFTNQWYTWFISFGAASTFLSFYFVRLAFPKLPYNKQVSNFMIATFVVLFINLISSEFWHSVILVQFQIIRVGIFALFFAYVYFTYYVVEYLIKQTSSQLQKGIIAITLMVSMSPLFLIGLYFCGRMKRLSARYIILFEIAFLSTVTVYYFSFGSGIWQPGISVYAQKSPNFDTQMWVRDHTSKDAVIIAPPYLWWFHALEWRVVSERTPVANFSELLEIAFVPSYTQTWKERFKDVAPGAVEKFKGDPFENFKYTKKAYYSLSTQQIKNIAYKYKAQYYVVEKPFTAPFEKVYENTQFIVYRVY